MWGIWKQFATNYVYWFFAMLANEIVRDAFTDRTDGCVCVCSGWTLQLCMCFLGLSVLFYAEKREGLDNVCG